MSQSTKASLIASDFTATAELGVAFGPQAIELGNLVRVSQVKEAPQIKIDAKDGNYLLMLIDPDAPTPADPKFAFWRHWVVSDLQSGVNATGKTLTEFLGPGPKPEYISRNPSQVPGDESLLIADRSAPHRYLFLLYRQPAGFSLSKEDVGGEEFVQRRSFDAAAFVKKHGLELAGVNWMTCAADEWAA